MLAGFSSWQRTSQHLTYKVAALQVAEDFHLKLPWCSTLVLENTSSFANDSVQRRECRLYSVWIG